MSANQVAYRVGRSGLSGASAGSANNRSCGSSLIASEILFNQPGPSLWS
jgi:hypothetical protein